MTWQSPLNKLFVPFRRNKVYASWKLYKTSISVNRGSHFQVRFVWQVWDGQLSPSFKYIRFWVIIDRPTPATQNGLENVIRGWPKWMFCKAFKKHKLCSSWRVQKAYWVGIAKSFADFCTCFSLVITPHNMPVSILFVCTATHVPWRTGRTKVALVELPAVNMVGFFFCTPFPRRILAWSFVVPRSHSHPPKALNI